MTLRAVAPDEKADKPKTKSLVEAVAGGVYLEILLAQQREIAVSLPEEKGPAKAALHRQLALISKEIESLLAAAEQEASEDVEADDEAFNSSAV